MSIPLGSLPHALLVTHRTAGTPDGYGNEVLIAGTTETVRGRVDIVSTTEQLADRNEQRERYDLVIAPTAAPVEGIDLITWTDEGIDLELEGPAVPVYDSGAPHHLEGTAYRTRG